MLLDDLNKKGLLGDCPGFLKSNTAYLTLMGSVAYGVSSDTSDCDIYGFCIPPKEIIFPHLTGEIHGFGKPATRFEQWQKAHIKDQSADKSYDITIYSIVKYFQLCMENNPNMIDSLFVSQNSIIHSSHVANMIRDKRHLFLHKGLWHKFKGYAYSSLHKMRSKNPQEGSKRKELREKFGYDVKYAYHVVRLLSQAEQILTTGDLDLQEKGRREHMKAIREGRVSQEEIEQWASDKEKNLENLYIKSDLPWGPPEKEIKDLLIRCLEHHYGNLDNCIVIQNREELAVKEIKSVLEKYKL